MTALLALGSALLIGTSDFAGGVASRRAESTLVALWTQLASLCTAVVVTAVLGWTAIVRADLIAGFIAGLSGGFSFIAFYTALAKGTMSQIAPVTAVVGASIPAMVGIASGDEMTVLIGTGLLLALLAIFLVTRGEDEEEKDSVSDEASAVSGFALAVVAGIGFSIFFLALAETSPNSGAVPLLLSRVVSAPLVYAAARRVSNGSVALPSGARLLAAFTGSSEMFANMLILIALQRGPLTIASVMGSLYPVSTVLLAQVVLGERLKRIQQAGVVLAVVSVALVAF